MLYSLLFGQRRERSHWADATEAGVSAEVGGAGRVGRARTWLLRGGLALAAFGLPALSVCSYQLLNGKAASAPRLMVPKILEKKPKTSLSAVRYHECLRQRDQVLKEPGVPGTPELDARRIEILARVKTEPVVFLKPPEHDPHVSTAVKRQRHGLATSAYPSTLLDILTKGFAVRPEYGRAVVLSDGYLYADEPERAFALVHHIRAEHLFDDAHIWIQRGERTLHATRTPAGQYVYADGPQEGHRVQLLLFDRIGTGVPPAALHRDFRSLKYRLHFDRATVVHMTDSHVVADLKYGGLLVPTVLKSAGARLELECEAVEPKAERDLALYRDRGVRELRVVQALRRVMLKEIDERLPFDEPYREFGQQDGVLRQNWRDAYFAHRSQFELNRDTYYVYDQFGRPRVPQVCVDFLMDTFERVSGTWWAPSSEPPRRIVGKLDFQTLDVEMLRRVPDFVDLARSRPEWFDVLDVQERDRVPFWRQAAFLKDVADHAHRYQPGDIVVIRGYTRFERKWETRVMHYHSFFVYESDPITEFPMTIVGNAGQPSLRVWGTEMRRTPKRSIWHRLRPRLYWLEKIVEAPVEPEPTPAPLSAG